MFSLFLILFFIGGGLYMTKEEKGKKVRIFVELLIAVLSLAAGVLGGSFVQNKYIESQVANVSGDGNTVTINNVDDLVKNFNKLLEENETLKEQNEDYYTEYKEAKETIDSLEVQLGDSPAIELKDLSLCVDGEDKNINKNKSYAVINGADYFSEDFLNSIIADNTAITIKDDVMYLGKVVADRENLFSQRIVDEGGASVVDNATDSYGNTHVNALKLADGNDIVFSLNEKYSLLKLKIAIDESSDSNRQCTVSILADGQEVWTSPQINKISTKELDYPELKINNCSRLEIKCSGDWSVYPLVYDAEVYN